MKKIITSVFILTVFLIGANPSSLPNDPTDTLHEDVQEPLINSEGLLDEHSGTKDIQDKDVEHIVNEKSKITTQDEVKEVVKDQEKSEKKFEDEEKDENMDKNSIESSEDVPEPLINSEGLVDEHSATKDIQGKDVEHMIEKSIPSTTQDEVKEVVEDEEKSEKKFEDEEKDVDRNSMKISDEVDKNTKREGTDFSDSSVVSDEKESENSSGSSLVDSGDTGTGNVEELHGDGKAQNLVDHPDEDQQKQTNPFKPKVMDVVEETQDIESSELSDSTSTVEASENDGDTKKPDPILQKPLDFKFNNFDLYDLEVAEAEMQREKEMEEELSRKSTKNVPRDDNSEKVLDSISEEIEDKEEEIEEEMDDKMESNDDILEDPVISGYQTGSVCNYCKYCNYCKICPKCHLCGKRDTGEDDHGHCHMCKNCKYCYLCDYLCLTICKPGGYVDVFTGTIYAVLPSFSKKGENDVSEDIEGTKDFVKEYL